jgi:hypothetical protein
LAHERIANSNSTNALSFSLDILSLDWLTPAPARSERGEETPRQLLSPTPDSDYFYRGRSFEKLSPASQEKFERAPLRDSIEKATAPKAVSGFRVASGPRGDRRESFLIAKWQMTRP